VLWSHIVNARYATDALTQAAPDEIEFKAELEAELEARRRRNGQALNGASSETTRGMLAQRGFIIDDFVRYMFRSGTRNEILRRFQQVVAPLLQAGSSFHIVAHSWGSVISYEGLRQFDDQNLRGRVATLFVIGTALSFKTVQRNLFHRTIDGRRPKVVQRIINIGAAGDIVGGRIRPAVDSTREYLNVKPVGCELKGWLRRIAKNPVCAHGSYFHADNKTVNRDILARHIQEQS
jgi:pimeloyl-ACP methyl ester carboxylesterase